MDDTDEPQESKAPIDEANTQHDGVLDEGGGGELIDALGGDAETDLEAMIEPVDEPQPYDPDADVPDPLYRTYRDLLDKVIGLPELPMQAALVERVLRELELDRKLWCVDQILRGALWGHRGGMETMMATVWWLIQMRRDDEYETIKTVYEAAYQDERDAVLDLFREVPPHRALADGQELPEVQLPHDREVTLGERRTLAAGPKRKLLKRLLMDPDPLVIRKLLDNPHIRIEEIRIVATRRPTTPEILEEIVFHPRWFPRFKAREAVVRNPYADTGLVLKLLPTLGIRPLRRIVYSGDLHELVQKSAKRLVKLREERTAPWKV